MNKNFMCGRGGDAQMGAVQALLLACVLSIPALGGISDARSASASTPTTPQSPAASSAAMTPPWLDTPRGGIVPAAPAESSSDPKPKSLPAPAATSHYAGSAENPYV